MTQRSLNLGAVVLVGLAAGCRPASPPLSPSEVRAPLAPTLPAAVEDPAWVDAPLHVAALILQDLVEPRQLQVTTREVRVQALTDGRRVVFRLAWDDASRDDTPGPSRFGDACAVQLPARTAPDVPAPQMGEEGRGVEISFWSSVLQASVDGRPDDIHALYPNAKVDHYPFEAAALAPGSAEQRQMAERYMPARAARNQVAGPHAKAVQDLVAEGPGSLAPAPTSQSEGRGGRTSSGWAVVLSRPLPSGLSLGGRTQVAFAVWDGARGEVGARKMRTGWVPLAVGEPPSPPAPRGGGL